MIHVVLFEPEIPPNTGNIIRLCANTGAELHLIHPLGFSFDHKQLKRAGLDYHEWTRIYHHQNYESFQKSIQGKRIFYCSTKGKRKVTDVSFKPDDVIMFGPETKGLPNILLSEACAESIIRIPMLSTSRSLNLSNAVAIVVYEAFRQFNFAGAS